MWRGLYGVRFDYVFVGDLASSERRKGEKREGPHRPSISSLLY